MEEYAGDGADDAGGAELVNAGVADALDNAGAADSDGSEGEWEDEGGSGSEGGSDGSEWSDVGSDVGDEEWQDTELHEACFSGDERRATTLLAETPHYLNKQGDHLFLHARSAYYCYHAHTPHYLAPAHPPNTHARCPPPATASELFGDSEFNFPTSSVL